MEWRKSLMRWGSPVLVQHTAYTAWGFQIATKQLLRKSHQCFQRRLLESDELHKGRWTVWPEVACPTACFRHNIPLPEPSLAFLLLKHQQKKVGELVGGAMKPAWAPSREGPVWALETSQGVTCQYWSREWLGTTHNLGLKKKGC